MVLICLKNHFEAKISWVVPLGDNLHSTLPPSPRLRGSHPFPVGKFVQCDSPICSLEISIPLLMAGVIWLVRCYNTPLWISEPAKPRILPKVKDSEGITYKLKNDPRCKDDIEDFCTKESRSGGNYDLLLCLQNQIKARKLDKHIIILTCDLTLDSSINILKHCCLLSWEIKNKFILIKNTSNHKHFVTF